MNIKMIKNLKFLAEVLDKHEMVIFKNRTRCPISRYARIEFEKFAETSGEKIELFMIDVVENNDVSQKFTEKTEIKHESPQVFYIINGKVIWHESHMNIKSEKLHEIVK